MLVMGWRPIFLKRKLLKQALHLFEHRLKRRRARCDQIKMPRARQVRPAAALDQDGDRVRAGARRQKHVDALAECCALTYLLRGAGLGQGEEVLELDGDCGLQRHEYLFGK
ncbi:hypothetical protein [Polaromonas sp.]|uniref:hypothetical protein n=1 Tax=Polaromonas sp. TaxID=1869339 RepID=UPI002487DBC7|nr:hypothetical protein [Polaromonas sp.]MDI1273299.1 hypothetical protein [Polaromonas sp.]